MLLMPYKKAQQSNNKAAIVFRNVIVINHQFQIQYDCKNYFIALRQLIVPCMYILEYL